MNHSMCWKYTASLIYGQLIRKLGLDKFNVHKRCNLGARHRWCIETGFLVEKRHGYQYEHMFSYNWNAMKGYHYLMRLGHLINILSHNSERLVEMVRELGVRGFIRFVRETLSGPWLDPLWVQKRLAAPFQLRLIWASSKLNQIRCNTAQIMMGKTKLCPNANILWASEGNELILGAILRQVELSKWKIFQWPCENPLSASFMLHRWLFYRSIEFVQFLW